MAKMTIANKTSNPIWRSGAIAHRIDLRTTCKPERDQRSMFMISFFFWVSIHPFLPLSLNRVSPLLLPLSLPHRYSLPCSSLLFPSILFSLSSSLLPFDVSICGGIPTPHRDSLLPPPPPPPSSLSVHTSKVRREGGAKRKGRRLNDNKTTREWKERRREGVDYDH